MTSTPTTPTTITDWIGEESPSLRRYMEDHEERLVRALHEMKQLIDSTLDAYAIGGKEAWQAISRIVDPFDGTDRVTPVAAKIGANASRLVSLAPIIKNPGDK